MLDFKSIYPFIVFGINFYKNRKEPLDKNFIYFYQSYFYTYIETYYYIYLKLIFAVSILYQFLLNPIFLFIIVV